MTNAPRSQASGARASGRRPLSDLIEKTQRGERIAMVTAYDAPSARLADAADVDVVLVGDSAAMTCSGTTRPVPVTMDEMLMLTRAVVRGTERAIAPSHTPVDGDVIFAIATGTKSDDADWGTIGALAAEVMADAIVRAAREATGIPGYPAARDLRR